MPAYVLMVDLFGVVLAAIGFTMAFRQAFARRLLGRGAGSGARMKATGEGQDPLTYILRIAGIMIMVFGIVIGGMVTLLHLS